MQYKWTAIWGLVCVLALGVGTAGAQESDSLWEPIFNKVDLDDWDVKIQGRSFGEDPNNTFRVEDSVLVMDYENYSSGDFSFGHLFYKDPFSFYILRTEYRFTGSQHSSNPGSWALQNNGLMLHSQSGESMSTGQDFPNSMETQLLGADNRGVGADGTLSLCTPGTAFYNQPSGGSRVTSHCNFATNERPELDEWAWATILVLGDSLVEHYNGPAVSGNPTFRYYRPHLDNGDPLTQGYISIQSESHPTEFRTIEVLNLVGCMDEEAGTYRDYYVRHEQDDCEEVGVKDQDRHGKALSWHPAEGLVLLPESGMWEVSLTAVDGSSRKLSTQGKRVSLFQEGSVPSGMYVIRAQSTGYDIAQKIFIP